MEIVEKRKWISITLLSIIIPVGLLVTFRLTNMVPEPALIAETITADTVYWNMSRPSQTVILGEWINNSYSDETISINSSVHIGGYFENSLGWPSYGDDEAHVTINVYANTIRGYIHSAIVRFSIIDASALLFIEPHPEATFSRNLRINRIHDPATSKSEAYVDAVGINQPNSASIQVFSFWVFFDKNNLNHEMPVASEIIYFNGTAFRKIILPIKVGLIASDNNDSFDTAFEIQAGTYPKLFLGGYDVKDYYKIYLTKGQRIDVCVDATFSFPAPDLELYLYNPTRDLKAAPADQREYHKTISCVADSTGYWYIETRIYANHGFYSLTVDVQE